MIEFSKGSDNYEYTIYSNGKCVEYKHMPFHFLCYKLIDYFYVFTLFNLYLHTSGLFNIKSYFYFFLEYEMVSQCIFVCEA